MNHFLPEYIQKVFKKNLEQGKFQGITFFIDIAGFTNLTENLMQHGKEGSELLHTYLEKIFPYYAGDAFFVIFEKITENDFEELCQFVANEAAKNKNFTSKFGAYSISFKAGVSAGNIDWGIVGKDNKSFYFKGEATERAIATWQKAEVNTLLKDTKACKAYFKKKISPEQLALSHEFSSESNSQLTAYSSQLFFPVFKNIPEPQPEFQYVATLFISFKNIETLILSASVLHRWILQIIILQIKFHLLSQSFNCNKYFKFSIKFYTSNYAVGIETEILFFVGLRKKKIGVYSPPGCPKCLYVIPLPAKLI